MIAGIVPGDSREGPAAIWATVASARDRAGAMAAGPGLRPLPAGTPGEHAPLRAVPPVALLTFALARARGANDDRPRWMERDHSQGLTHILVGPGETEP